MFSIFFAHSLSYVECKDPMSFNSNGTYNLVLGRNAWKYYYATFNPNITAALRFTATTTGPTKVFMQVIGKCPFFGDPMVLETKGSVVNETAVSPYMPHQNIFIVGIYSQVNDNNITLYITSERPLPKWRKNLPIVMKYVGAAIMVIAVIGIIIYAVKSYKDSVKAESHKHKKERRVGKHGKKEKKL